MKSRKLTTTLLIAYMLVLSWIVLFKATLTFTYLNVGRSINLIPFGAMLVLNGKANYNEIIYNVLVFVPLGIFLCMLAKKKSFAHLVVPIVLLSLFYEVVQYIFAIGASDITDLIANSLGGVIGIGVFYVFHKIFKDNVNKVLNTTALVFALILAAALGLYISALLLGALRFQ